MRAMHSVSDGLKRLKRSTGWLRATSQHWGVLRRSWDKGPAVQASLANTFDASEPWQVPTWIFRQMRRARSTCDALSNDLSHAVKRSGSRAGCQLARTDPSLHEGDAGRHRAERHDGLHVSADLRAHGQARKAWLSGTPQRSSSAQAVRATCFSVTVSLGTMEPGQGQARHLTQT